MNNYYNEILEQAYRLFNERDIEHLLQLMDNDVQWPNGWEGGFVNGQEEVRDYWTRQWKEIDPVVTPISIHKLPDDRFEVEVRQVVNDKQGNQLFDGTVIHTYLFAEGKVKAMEITEVK